jgi:futalosine hydrolase
MNLLIAAATAKEIQPFLAGLKNKEWIQNNQHQTDVLITGIGLTAATYGITRQLLLKRYDLVIQAGVAGCFNKNISLGTVVVVKKDCIADQSVVELQQLKSLFELKLVPRNQFPYKNKWLNNTQVALLKSTGLKQVTGISVNEITTQKQKRVFYEDLFNPVTESMEGAALHYVCLMQGVPFLQIRSMSNYIAERNKKKWNMMDSITNLNIALTQIIGKWQP